MAQSTNNEITHGARGKFGELIVFKQKGEKTLMSKVPRASTAGPTVKQDTVRATFVKAILYGKRVLADATLKLIYKAKATIHRSAYNLAVKDFFKAPVIQETDVSAYNGATGSIITITATDNFKVNAVGVRIERPDGSLVESGDAVQQGDSAYWIYTTTHDNLNRAGHKVIVSANDLPGNVTTAETTLS